MSEQNKIIDFTPNEINSATHLSLKDAECMTVVRILNSNYVGYVIVIIESADVDEILTKRMTIEEAENTFNVEITK
jgi:hypothetical protein